MDISAASKIRAKCVFCCQFRDRYFVKLSKLKLSNLPFTTINNKTRINSDLSLL